MTASVAIAVLASLGGLGLAYRFRSDESRADPPPTVRERAPVRGAIAGMHYTGMAAAHFTAARTDRASGRRTAGDRASSPSGSTLGTLLILGTRAPRRHAGPPAAAPAPCCWSASSDAQKLEAIGQLAGGIAHDFNNLLTAILGHAAFLKQDPASEDPAGEDIEQIERAASRAAELTRQLLAFGRRRCCSRAQC